MLDTWNKGDKTESSEERTMPEDEIDEVLEETFPASDPPQWTLGVDPHPQTNDDKDRD